MDRSFSPPLSQAHFDDLLERLREAEETLDAIRHGEVDAVVVGGSSGQKVYTLENADRPYRVIIEQMREGAVTLSADGTILYCNERFADILGHARESLIGREALHFVAPADTPVFAELMAHGPASGRSAELSLINADSVGVPVNFSVVDLDMGQDSARLLCGVVTDLTRSRQRSHELAAANARLAAEIDVRRRAEESLEVALDAAGMGGWDLDLAQGLIHGSKRFDEIFGREGTPGPWLVGELLARFLPEDRPAVQAGFEAARRVGSIEFELRIERLADGARRWIHVKGRVHRQQGRNGRLAGVVSDVTTRRMTEQQLRQAQKMEAIGQLTGGIAHDFNNLLMVIGGSMDMLEEHMPGDERSRRYFAAARQGVERGALLNRQLLAFSRRQDLRQEAVCIDDRVHSFQGLLERALGETITLQLVEPEARWLCTTDPHQLETAILNLAINARDAMPNGGTVSISTRRVVVDSERAQSVGAAAGNYVAVSIADTGEGMTPDVASKVFEPFFTTKAVGKGTGLGLSQVYGFVRQSDGFITIDSTPGQGTTMTLHFPLTDDPEQARAKDDAAVTLRGTGSVLVVEDDASVRDIAVRSLGDLGYTVFEASHAQSALDVVASGVGIDLVFSDVIMPGDIGGMELVQRLRRSHPAMALLLTSGYTGQAMADQPRPADVQLLAKPYTRATLSAAVDAALEKARARLRDPGKPGV
ncbi:hybrid sensor histidine kinase/response regulator [Pinirhizobacter soli]|uniref:hybrid sensor histidine kinase/response regulator n=1 Tax=Pinirhizobacter soli TaxID=2786953 RepID=UPI002029E081|nr:PAS domain-containing sensor histidine kinase [Pinirhizobacter soli]